MNKIKLIIASCFAASILMGCASEPIAEIPLAVQQSNKSEITVATWNVEHLAFPIDSGCKPRTAEEIAELKAYAQSINADVVALQEVASAEAVELLFPLEQWRIFMSTRPDSESYSCRGSGNTSTQQKLAFAVQKQLNVSNVIPLADLNLGRLGLRYGLEIQLESDFGPLSLLNVHLKSGCFVDNLLTSDREACEVLARQAPILESWIDEKETLGKPYVVLGDFNHRLSAPYNQLTRDLTTSSDGIKRSIVNTGANLIGCHPRYPAPIDHVFIGNLDRSSIAYNTKVHRFDDMQEDAMLSDHCAVATTLSSTQAPLSNAVKWLTASKEYQLISKGIYQQAEIRLSEMTLPSVPWVVVMDVDETVLDNRGYQVTLDHSGASYSPQTWDYWVRSQQATLVPGSLAFIQKIFSMGGKVALITNREKIRDIDTWQNLSKFMSLTSENTCLVGRTQADKNAVNGGTIVNDKDLRRQQLVSGSIDCFSTQNDNLDWQSGHTILMHIGDNIEDIDGITQHQADTDALRSRWGKDVFILPNPMYGSW